MSMYAVNASVPKTLVRHLVRYYADTCGDETLKQVLLDVLDTPVSPELLPPEDGKISQKTEDLVGPYELHDFYLYDWHKKGTFHGIRRLFEMHGFSHPGRACVNAEQVFHITKKEQSIISSHMWPLTFRHVPSCREAIIVCLADKYCAVVESMFKHSRVAAAKNANGEYDEW